MRFAIWILGVAGVMVLVGMSGCGSGNNTEPKAVQLKKDPRISAYTVVGSAKSTNQGAIP